MESDWTGFETRGVRVVTIAAQKIDGMSHARRFVEEHAYPFPVLFDETRRVTRAYGVYHGLSVDAYRIARPAVFVLDRNAVIRWIGVSPNQRVRPSTSQVVAALEDAVRHTE